MSNWWRPTFTFMSCLRVRKSASMLAYSITSWYPQSYTSGPSSPVPTARSKHYCSHFRVYYYLFVCLLPVFTAPAFQPSHGERKVQHSHSVILRNPLHRTPSIINQNYGIITRLGFLSWFFVFLKKKKGFSENNGTSQAKTGTSSWKSDSDFHPRFPEHLF